MKAEAMSFTFLSNEGLITIPFFQRGYVWDTNNWEELLNDLLDAEKSHFLGSVILKQHNSQTGKHKEALVIDGQQRLTTLSILFRALYDTFDSETQENCKISLSNHLFFKKSQTSRDIFIKISHSKVDKKYYEKIIKNMLSTQEYNEINNHSNKILRCYKYFTEELNKIDDENRLDLFDRLTNVNNKILVVIDLSEKEDEQAIFDTINSAGVRLSSADIIKNAIYQRAIDVFSDISKVENYYKEYWEDIFMSDEDTVLFWETSRPTGRFMRDNIEILFHCFSVINGFFDPDKHTLSDISNLYKKYINNLESIDLENFIKDIAKYAKIFRNKILVFNNTSLFEYDDIEIRLFHILNTCEISTLHPYILFLYYKYEKDVIKLHQELYNLEKLIVRRLINKSDTKNYNKMCKDFINNSSIISDKIAEQSDDLIKNAVRNISNKTASLILFWIELYRRHIDKKESIKGLKYNYSLEHIMPQKWEEFWKSIDIVDYSGNKIKDKETAKNTRYSAINEIGNMTLLNSSLNTSLRNYELTRKIEGEGRKKGIRAYNDLHITKYDIIKEYDNGNNIWNESKIRERTDKLVKYILDIW